jgi:hypothetical protein
MVAEGHDGGCEGQSGRIWRDSMKTTGMRRILGSECSFDIKRGFRETTIPVLPSMRYLIIERRPERRTHRGGNVERPAVSFVGIMVMLENIVYEPRRFNSTAKQSSSSTRTASQALKIRCPCFVQSPKRQRQTPTCGFPSIIAHLISSLLPLTPPNPPIPPLRPCIPTSRHSPPRLRHKPPHTHK